MEIDFEKILVDKVLKLGYVLIKVSNIGSSIFG